MTRPFRRRPQPARVASEKAASLTRPRRFGPSLVRAPARHGLPNTAAGPRTRCRASGTRARTVAWRPLRRGFRRCRGRTRASIVGVKAWISPSRCSIGRESGTWRPLRIAQAGLAHDDDDLRLHDRDLLDQPRHALLRRQVGLGDRAFGAERAVDDQRVDPQPFEAISSARCRSGRRRRPPPRSRRTSASASASSRRPAGGRSRAPASACRADSRGTQGLRGSSG